MKICIPAKENNGLETIPYNHFGSAPIFLVFDTETSEITAVNNGDLNHEHGKCQPIKAIGSVSVDVVLVLGIGLGAINKLNSMGIKVFKAENKSIKENIDLLNKNELPEFDSSNSCTSHSCGTH
ncbi:NifB/NifX family molybdenum-iron cluster-binding protein [Clostridium sp.]|uniref:NifB/NifX family molybdenum-iron cluster-binding protein n=1 Tax=Clostridium sp. TaxID=1506 RepID=UPI002FCBF48A